MANIETWRLTSYKLFMTVSQCYVDCIYNICLLWYKWSQLPVQLVLILTGACQVIKVYFFWRFCFCLIAMLYYCYTINSTKCTALDTVKLERYWKKYIIKICCVLPLTVICQFYYIDAKIPNKNKVLAKTFEKGHVLFRLHKYCHFTYFDGNASFYKSGCNIW